MPGSASGELINAVVPGAPAVATSSGGRPSTAPITSRIARAVTFTEVSGGATDKEARPSVNGHWAIAAASR